MQRALILHCTMRKATKMPFVRRRMSSMHVFDRPIKRIQRNAALMAPGSENFDYLRQHVAANLTDRIEDINREFTLALDIGCHAGHIYQLISEKESLTGNGGGVGGIKTLVQSDMSDKAIFRAKAEAASLPIDQRERVRVHYVQADEEELDGHFDPHTFDLVISNLCLHWVNDLPKTMKQIRSILKPDGVFIGSMLGGSTLTELRSCLLLAEQEREGGMSVHTSPTAQVSDCGNLLSAAGFAIPTVDQDVIEVEYPDMFTLMEHIQGMGEKNAALGSRRHVSRDTFLSAAALYQHRFGTPENNITASFQVLYMIGWAPHSSQPQPKARGSAKHSLRDLNQFGASQSVEKSEKDSMVITKSKHED